MNNYLLPFMPERFQWKALIPILQKRECDQQEEQNGGLRFEPWPWSFKSTLAHMGQRFLSPISQNVIPTC